MKKSHLNSVWLGWMLMACGPSSRQSNQDDGTGGLTSGGHYNQGSSQLIGGGVARGGTAATPVTTPTQGAQGGLSPASTYGSSALPVGGVSAVIGGTSFDGGAPTTGGTVPGATTAIGGTPTTGGVPITGGAAPGSTFTAGGTPMTGGGPAKGGAPNTGGTNAGGKTAGSTPIIGGTAAGGSPTTGGTAAGGSPTTGGTAAGGSPTTGGTATGGTLTAMGGGGSSPGPDVFVDPAHGNDNASGDRIAPVLTLSRASKLAAERGSTTIWLLDGQYDETTESGFSGSGSGGCGNGSGVSLPAGIALRADHPGKARFVVAGDHGLCVSGGRISGITLLGNNNRRLIEATAGTLEIDTSTFAGCGFPGVSGAIATPQSVGPTSACVVASGTATVRLLASNAQSWLSGAVGTFGAVLAQATLELTGGVLDAASEGATLGLFAVAGQGTIRLASIAVTGASGTSPKGIGIRAQDDARVWVTNSSMESLGIVAAVYSDGVRLTLEDVIATNSQYGVVATGSAGVGPSIGIQRTRVTGSDAAVMLQSGPANLAIVGSDFSGNTAGILINGSGALDLSATRITNNQDGVRFSTSAGVGSMRLRNVEISSNSRVGLSIAGNLEGTFDLGNVADPGNNVLTKNATATSNGANLVVTGAPPVIVLAVGNTWDASVQGADSEGRYTVSGAGSMLDVTGGVGPNYRVLTGSSRIRLAENP